MDLYDNDTLELINALASFTPESTYILKINIENKNITFFDTTFIDDMAFMFMDEIFFNKLLLWNTQNVRNMSMMFKNCKRFNKSLYWHVSNVEYMFQMFYNAYNFNKKIKWKVSNLKTCDFMFENATRLSKAPIFIDSININTSLSIFKNTNIDFKKIDKYSFTNNLVFDP